MTNDTHSRRRCLRLRWHHRFGWVSPTMLQVLLTVGSNTDASTTQAAEDALRQRVRQRVHLGELWSAGTAGEQLKLGPDLPR